MILKLKTDEVRKPRARATAMLAALALALAPGAAAEGPFEDEDIEIIVPFAEDGGTDRWARFYAGFMVKHYPGVDDVDVENEPGEHGPLDAANEFAAETAEAVENQELLDGLKLLALSGSHHFPYLLSDDRAAYDYDAWEVLLVSPVGGVVYASPDLTNSYIDIGRLKGQQLRYVAQSPVGLDIVPLLALELLGVQPVARFGAESRAEGFEEFEDEEVLIDFQTTPSYLKHVAPLADDGDAVPLFSLGVLNRQGELERDPTFPDLPHFGEAFQRVHSRKPSGKKFEIWKTLLAAGFSAQKMLMVPKNIPPETLAAHRAGFEAILADPEFKREVTGALGQYPQHLDAQARRLKDLAVSVDQKMLNEIGFWLVSEALPRWTEAGQQ